MTTEGVLVVDEVDDFFSGMSEAGPKGFQLVHATSGGEGLDRASTGMFHCAMIAEDVSDLPAKQSRGLKTKIDRAITDGPG